MLNKRLRKEDWFFCIALLCCLAFHLTLIWAPHRLFDETFYPTVPYRLIKGDSLIQHEWHLTQFSAVFLYFPVRLWLLIKSSTDGIYLYLRFVYILAQTCAAIVIYKFFRNKGIWAAVASIMFYILIPYRTYALSYTSMLALFYLFFSLSLFSIYKTHSMKSYISAGFFYGCCCVNNPIFCIFFMLYLVLCILWQKNEIIINLLSNIYTIKSIEKKKPKKTQKKGFIKEKNKAIEKKERLILGFKTYNCFFCKKAIMYTSIGLSAIAIISVIFFFATGGTLSSLFKNFENLMQSSEYFTTSKGAWIQKSFDFKNAINFISLNKVFLLPALLFAIFIDKKKKTNIHRVTFLFASFALSTLFVVGMSKAEENTAFFYSLPFTFFSFVCYILTEKKQTDLFYCIWCPCIAAATLSGFASNTLFYSSSAICAISNIVGVFFVSNLFKEMTTNYKVDRKLNSKEISKKIISIAGQITIILAICLQLTFSCFTIQQNSNTHKNNSSYKSVSGPLKGMFFTEENYIAYESILKNLDYIKETSNENDPLLILGNLNWIYMYSERPFATYSAYYLGLEIEPLANYYKENPEKIPKHIYIMPIYNYEILQTAEESLEAEREKLDYLFEYTEEKLDNAILLTVTDYKF